MILPRPDVTALGVSYRRIPIMAIGRDVYHDTRLIIAKLEALFPVSADHPSINVASPDGEAMMRLLTMWIVDGGVFTRCSQLLPAAVLQNEKFVKDREQLSGRSWSVETMYKNRPEALVELRGVFDFLENTILKDGRKWVFRTDAPTLVDIEGESSSRIVLW